MKRVLKVAVVVLTMYGLLLGGFYLAMSQRPDVFSQVMAKAPGIVFMAFPFKPMWMSARGGRLRVGDEAPDFQLETYDKKANVQLAAWKGKKPVVLVFGSYTWPPFRREVPALNQLYQQYREQVEFYLVYIQEAHASDGWQLAVNERENVVYEDPKAYEDRVNLAGTCAANLNIEFPALVDTIENTTEAAYTGWPDRLYLIDRDGRIAFKSEAGPFGFKVDLLSTALENVVGPAATPQEAPRPWSAP